VGQHFNIDWNQNVRLSRISGIVPNLIINWIMIVLCIISHYSSKASYKTKIVFLIDKHKLFYHFNIYVQIYI